MSQQINKHAAMRIGGALIGITIAVVATFTLDFIETGEKWVRDYDQPIGLGIPQKRVNAGYSKGDLVKACGIALLGGFVGWIAGHGAAEELYGKE